MFSSTRGFQSYFAFNTILKVISIISILAIFSCASGSAKQSQPSFGKWEFSSDPAKEKKDKKPDEVKQEPVKDQLVFHVKAKGSDSAIEEKNFPKIMSTCAQIAKTQAAFNLMQGLFMNRLSSENKSEPGAIFLQGKDGSEEYKCNFTISEKTVVSECKGEVKGIQSSSCTPLTTDPSNEDYGYCNCGFKWNYEGGEKRLNQMIKFE
ncbi:MAG: hypothetical protein L6Q54_00135 [Leptospiraceae bacterium]|nr:hypothetical protein [Leptospiraceae bacterium]MCK6379645.1 hypothetical protein [Leptospiraceae bacterium]NUM40099.1 hypothetical protein [Leptospiraceae bacterium]